MENQTHPTQQPFPLKWHYFLTRFSLWLSMVFGVLDGVGTVLGVQYGAQADRVFLFYPSLRLLHIAYLIASVLIAVYTFIVRGRLARFEWAGVKGLNRLYILNPLISAVHTMLMVAMTGLEMGETFDFMELVSPFIGAVAAVIINNTYYGKRAALFAKE